MAPMRDAVRAFVLKRPRGRGSVVSIPPQLLSYRVVIGRWQDCAIHLPEYDRFYIRTTNRHRRLLIATAQARGIPIILEYRATKGSVI